MTKRGIELLQGTLQFLILQALRGDESRHGFEILRWIRGASDGALEIEEGALYPALHRMEKKGHLESEWGISEKNRKAKYYRLTTAGQTALEQEERSWREFVDVVARVMATSRAG